MYDNLPTFFKSLLLDTSISHHVSKYEKGKYKLLTRYEDEAVAPSKLPWYDLHLKSATTRGDYLSNIITAELYHRWSTKGLTDKITLKKVKKDFPQWEEMAKRHQSRWSRYLKGGSNKGSLPTGSDLLLVNSKFLFRRLNNPKAGIKEKDTTSLKAIFYFLNIDPEKGIEQYKKWIRGVPSGHGNEYLYPLQGYFYVYGVEETSRPDDIRYFRSVIFFDLDGKHKVYFREPKLDPDAKKNVVLIKSFRTRHIAKDKILEVIIDHPEKFEARIFVQLRGQAAQFSELNASYISLGMPYSRKDKKGERIRTKPFAHLVRFDRVEREPDYDRTVYRGRTRENANDLTDDTIEFLLSRGLPNIAHELGEDMKIKFEPRV